MHILVTGGAGYVGTLLIPALLEKGHRVSAFDLCAYPSSNGMAPSPASPDQYRLYRGDIRDVGLLTEALEGVDVVIHLAAISNDPSGDLDTGLTESVNYSATLQLLCLARQSGVGRFIFASSASVYGISEEERVTEELPLKPLTAYARCKAKAETRVREANDDSFTTIILRPATLCGVTPRLRLDLTVNILTYHAVSEGKISVFGGSQDRPNLHVRDMVRAYELMLDADAAKVAGREFNVGTENLQVITIAEMIRESLGLDCEIEVVPTNDQRSYRLDSRRIQSELDFVPEFPVRHAIHDLADHFARHSASDFNADHHYNVRFMKTHMELFRR